MKLRELKKAKPKTMKSSGTDDPKKYVGGWETYDEPQGINDRQDRKVLAKESVEDWDGKFLVWDEAGFRITVDDPTAASYVVAWTDDGVRIGQLSTRGIPGYREWLGVSSVNIDKQYQGNRLGLRMYQMLLKYLKPSLKGIVGYLPDMANKKQVPSIYRRLGGKIDPENADIILVPRSTIMDESFAAPLNRFVPDLDQLNSDALGNPDEKLIQQSKKAPKKIVRATVRALSARGKPPQLDPHKVNETIRRPFAGSLTNDYDIVDNDDDVIGSARIENGVIQQLDYQHDTSAARHRGQVLSALLDMIVKDADRNSANLSIQVTGLTSEIKYLLERYGFKLVGGTVLKRGYGSIRPGTVSPPQGMTNRMNETLKQKSYEFIVRLDGKMVGQVRGSTKEVAKATAIKRYGEGVVLKKIKSS